MTYHHHIIAYYLHMAEMAKTTAFSVFTEQYYLGRAFLYADFD